MVFILFDVKYGLISCTFSFVLADSGQNMDYFMYISFNYQLLSVHYEHSCYLILKLSCTLFGRRFV